MTVLVFGTKFRKRTADTANAESFRIHGIAGLAFVWLSVRAAMPRKDLIRSKNFPYHVTARANNREPFPLDLEKMWRISASESGLVTVLYGARIHAFVMMPNHFHMLVSTPDEDLGVVMNFFMSSVTRIANSAAGRSGHIFGGPYFRTLIQSSLYFAHALKYVYRNPVRAQLCNRVEDYAFSTLHGLLGQSHLPFPVFMTETLLDVGLPSEEPGSWLEWLNRPSPVEADEFIKKALRKKSLEKILDRRTRRPPDCLQTLF
ncbi:MAG: hypothetical protein NDJ89_03420 [Oligoflexia bacterium]|nr:hypothetical protein [Oligoflexia bacterium]